MRKSLLWLLIPLSVPIVAIIFAAGDYGGWWDSLRGRDLALQGLERLSCGEPHPVGWVYANETEFAALERIIDERTENPVARAEIDSGHHPRVMTAVYGERLETSVPEGYPSTTFVPDTTLVMYVYAAGEMDQLTWVGSLRDIRFWIEDDRNRDRLVGSMIIVGLLPIVVILYDALRRRNQIREEENKS
jgi:hypothetical protein